MTAAPRILFIDDKPETHASARRDLRREFAGARVTEVSDRAGFARALEAGDFDLAITGDHLPWTGVLDALRALKARRPDCPVILFASSDSEETILQAMKEGLDDYVFKMQHHDERLCAAARIAIETSAQNIERRKAEEALRQSEERFQRFLRTNPVGVTITTLDEGRFLEVNDHYLELTGYSREEIVGRTVFDLGTWADPRDRARVVEGLRAAGVLRDFDARYRTRSGEIRQALTSFEIIDYGGQPAILALTNDITERKKAEQALRASEEQYRLLFDRNLLPMWIFDVDTLAFLAVNEAAVAHYGYSRREFLAMTIKDIRCPEDVPALVEYLARLEREGGRPPLVSTGVWRHRKKDGTLIDVEVTRSPLLFQGRGACLVLADDVTERKRMEETLRDSEERYRTLVANLPDVAWTGDREGRITFISPNVEALAGFSPEEIYQGGEAHWSNWTHPDDVDRVWRAYRSLFGRGGPYDVEYRLRRRDGTWVWLHERALKTYQRDGTWYADGISTDITERKRMEEALRESEEKYRSLVANVPDVPWTSNRSGGLVLVSPNDEKLSGYSPEETYQGGERIWLDNIHPADRDKVIQAWNAFWTADGKYEVEYRSRRKDGEWIWVHDRAVAKYERDGAWYADGISSDITVRKEAEEALKQSEEKYRSLVANIPDDTWTCDSEGRVTFASPNVESLTGFSPEEIRSGGGAHWSERAHPDDVDRVWSRYRALFETGVPYDVEYRLRRKDGAWVWLHERALKTYQRDGVWYADGISSDITERKEAGERLKCSERQLQEAQQVGHIGSWEWNVVTGTLTWSHELYCIYGLDPLRFTPTYDAFLERVCVEDRDRVRSTIEKALRDRRPFSYDCHIRRPDGSLRVKQSRGEIVLDASGRPVRMVGIAQDITERRQAEEERARLLESERIARAEAEAALSRLQSIQRVTDATLAHLTLDDLLRELLGRIQAVLAADTVVVYLLSKDRAWLSVRACEGLQKKDAVGHRIPLGQRFAGAIAVCREPKMIARLDRARSGRCPFHAGVCSLLGVPLVVEGNVIGVLEIGSRQPRCFAEDDLHLLQLVADRVAPAIDRARLFEEVRQGREQLRALSRSLVELQETERRLIARELHDEVGQLLTGLKLAIENGARFRRSRAGQKEAKTIVNDLISRVRNLSMNLRPAMLDDLGLVPALLWHFERYTTQTGVRVKFHHSGAQSRLPSEIETAAFRITQEALTNVARHAGVKEVKVNVRASAECLCIHIKDQGAGFEPEIILAGASSGLTGMRERVNLLNGWLTIESAPGSGTHLTAELPLAAEAGMRGAHVRNHNHRARRRPPGRAAGSAGVAGI